MNFILTICDLVGSLFPSFFYGAAIAFLFLILRLHRDLNHNWREKLSLSVLLLLPLCWRILFNVRGERYVVFLVFGSVFLTVWFLSQIRYKYLRYIALAAILLTCLMKFASVNLHERDFIRLLAMAKTGINDEPQGADIVEISNGERGRFEYYSGLKIKSFSHLVANLPPAVVVSLNLDALSRTGRPTYILAMERLNYHGISAETLGIPSSYWTEVSFVFRNNHKKSRLALYRFQPLSSPCWPTGKELLENGDFEVPAENLFREKLFQGQLHESMRYKYPQQDQFYPANCAWILTEQPVDAQTWIIPSSNPISGACSMEVSASQSTALSFISPRQVSIDRGKLLRFKARGEIDSTLLRFMFHYFAGDQSIGWAAAEYTLRKGEVLTGWVPILPIKPLLPQNNFRMTVCVFSGRVTLDDISLTDITSPQTLGR